MRRTRDKWTFSQLGFTLNTPDYEFTEIIERGFILGIFAVVVQYTILTPIMWIKSGSIDSAIIGIHSFSNNGELFTANQLKAEYYFGFVEMGFI